MQAGRKCGALRVHFFFFFFLSLAVGGEVCHDVSLGVLSEVFTVCHKSMAPTVHDTEPKFSEMSCPFLSFPFLSLFSLYVSRICLATKSSVIALRNSRVSRQAYVFCHSGLREVDREKRTCTDTRPRRT